MRRVVKHIWNQTECTPRPTTEGEKQKQTSICRIQPLNFIKFRVLDSLGEEENSGSPGNTGLAVSHGMNWGSIIAAP